MGDDASAGVVWHTNETGGEDSDDDGASVEMAKPEVAEAAVDEGGDTETKPR